MRMVYMLHPVSTLPALPVLAAQHQQLPSVPDPAACTGQTGHTPIFPLLDSATHTLSDLIFFAHPIHADRALPGEGVHCGSEGCGGWC